MPNLLKVTFSSPFFIADIPFTRKFIRANYNHLNQKITALHQKNTLNQHVISR
ncbi:hypothetical protein PALB_360 [Pseudoalteromonas luteoviolacea B = ATCC 29581]|nr:hypothetical protein PALB_360 [Pseudoalteromonas luteoviolacea B = ATCC 29581]